MASRSETFERLKIAVRERPLRNEEKSKVQLTLQTEGDKLVAFYPDTKEGLIYNYDYFFPQEASQLDIFQSIGVQMVDSVMDGYSTSCVSFGSCGTGKTHTLFGSDHEAGLIQLSCKELFHRIESSSGQNYSVHVSYWEMSCDKIEDALIGIKKGTSNASINGRISSHHNDVPKFDVQRGDEGIHIANLTKIPVDSWEVLDELLMHGNIRRIQLSEARNARWHGFVKVYVNFTQAANPDCIVSATLTFAHLKGTDRVGQKGARGNILHHGSDINKSMSLFSAAIIHSLHFRHKKDRSKTDEELRKLIVQSQSFFMESKVTQILGQCICGTECSFMIGCVSSLDYHETTDTLEVLQNAQKLTACVRRRERLTQKGKLKAKIEKKEQELPRHNLADGHPLSEIEEHVISLRRKLNRMNGIEDADEDELLRNRVKLDIQPIPVKPEAQLWKTNVIKGKLHGDRHTVYIPNSKGLKNTYIGQWVNGMKEGLGKHETETTRYEGGWLSGLRHGEGTLWTRRNKHSQWYRIYTGSWKNDKPDGIGYDFSVRGDVYEGGFENGKRSGIGNLYKENGDRIEGQFKDGEVHGLAILYCRNGDYFEGSWFKGLKEGPGVWHYMTKQQLYEGEWHLDVAKMGVYSDMVEKESNKTSSFLPKVELVDRGYEILEEERLKLDAIREEKGITVNLIGEEVKGSFTPSNRVGSIGRNEQVSW
eukprot:Tbor_TRINITY_DN978_c0_g1::TRINITY_DN978_c0_g1_i1::g.21221::m.21221